MGGMGSNLSSLPLEGFPDTFTLDNGYAGYLAFQVGEGTCDTSLLGCTEPDALNFVQGANTDDGSCVLTETFEHTVNSEVGNRSTFITTTSPHSRIARWCLSFMGTRAARMTSCSIRGSMHWQRNSVFAVRYPQGINDSYGNAFFNVGYDFQFNENVDDVAFTLALNDYLQVNYALDETAVYATGMSNGGDFVICWRARPRPCFRRWRQLQA